MAVDVARRACVRTAFSTRIEGSEMAEQLIPIGHVDESDTLGNTLHHAAFGGSKKALKRVLDKGIHVDFPNDEGQSPLFCACYSNNEGVVDYLLSAGANPNEKSNSGLTPVIVAGYSGNVKILIKLLNSGGDLRLHDNHGRNVKDWAMLQPVPKRRMKMLEFLDKARLFAMSSSGQDLLMKKAPSNILHRAHHRQNTITKIIRNRIGRHSVHDNLEKMATSHHSLGFGQVYANGSDETGFLSAIPLISESSLRHDADGETYNNGAFAVMESMWWDYTEVTIKRLHRDIDPFQGGVVDLLINEIEHIGKLRHPHVLTLMGVCQTNNLDGLVLIYERIGQGSLFNCLHQKMERLPSQAIQDIAVQMCNAIIFMHLRGLVHCAITSHAISVVNSSTFKLGNFEYMVESSKCELGKKNSVMTNTNENCIYNWLAPEVMFNLPPSFYCDMFSFCVVLWELFHGDIPWDSQSSEAIRSQYSKGNGLRIYQTKIAEYYKVILEYGLELDPNKRKLSFLHVRDLLLAAPKDAKYYLKTHFKHLSQSDQNASKVKPSAPQIQNNQGKTQETPNTTSRAVEQSLREKHERRKMKEKERDRQLEDSDYEPKVEVERLKHRREEENRRIKRNREEVKGRAEEKQREQYNPFSTGSRQVKAQNVDDRNNHCSSLQSGWSIPHENLDGSPRKAAEHKQFKTEGLDWEILPEEEGEEYTYTVQVTKQPSPKKRPMSPLKATMQERVTKETTLRPPCTPPRKDVIEVTSSEDVGSSTDTTSPHEQFAKGRELGRVTSSMGRFSYLNLDHQQKSRSLGVKPACHTTRAMVPEEYSTSGKLTTAGSVFALYNDHSTDLPMGQLSHREPPDYATLRKRLLNLKQATPPPVTPDNSRFEGKGSVRDLAKVFQQQIQEHDFYQSVLDGKLGQDQQDGEHGKDYSNHAKKRFTITAVQDKDDKASFGSLLTVSMSDTGELEGKCDTDTASTFTSTSLTDSKDIQLSSSRESDLVSQWVDHEIRKIKRNLSTQTVDKGTASRKCNRSPDIFGTRQLPETSANQTIEDSTSNRVVSASSSDQDNYKHHQSQHMETGDHMKDPDTVGDFYFDDELYTKRGKKCARLYFDEETSVTSISESPVSSSLPMETVLKANSASSVEEKPDALSQKQTTSRKKISRIPTSRSRLAQSKSPDGAYSNIVTVTSSLDHAGLHQVTHKMKNLKTGGTRTLVNDTVNAQKIVTKLRSAN